MCWHNFFRISFCLLPVAVKEWSYQRFITVVALVCRNQSGNVPIPFFFCAFVLYFIVSETIVTELKSWREICSEKLINSFIHSFILCQSLQRLWIYKITCRETCMKYFGKVNLCHTDSIKFNVKALNNDKI